MTTEPLMVQRVTAVGENDVAEIEDGYVMMIEELAGKAMVEDRLIVA